MKTFNIKWHYDGMHGATLLFSTDIESAKEDFVRGYPWLIFESIEQLDLDEPLP